MAWVHSAWQRWRGPWVNRLLGFREGEEGETWRKWQCLRKYRALHQVLWIISGRSFPQGLAAGNNVWIKLPPMSGLCLFDYSIFNVSCPYLISSFRQYFNIWMLICFLFHCCCFSPLLSVPICTGCSVTDWRCSFIIYALLPLLMAFA